MSHILYHHRIASKDGQQVHVDEIIRAFKKAGHQVTLVAPSVSTNSDFGSDGGIITKLKSKLPQFIYELLELGYSLLVALKLYRVIKREKIDFIYERYNLYQPAGILISKLTKTPLMLEINAPLMQERKKYSGLAFPKLAKMIENFTWRNADKVFPVTDVLAEHLREAKVDEANIAVIHNGVRTIYAEAEKSVLNPDEKKELVIGFVGFMHLTCGVDKVLALLSSYPELPLKLVCVGDGDILSKLKHEAKVLGVERQVEFTGLLGREQVFDYIKTFDVALQPEVTAYASPLKMFEYMSVKSLIVAPRLNNIKEILTEDSAILFDPLDEQGFSNALLSAVVDFKQHDSKRQKAFNLLKEGAFTWEDNVKKILTYANKT